MEFPYLTGLETVQLLYENGANINKMVVSNTPIIQLESKILNVSTYKEDIESFVKRINSLNINELMFIYNFNNANNFRAAISKVPITV